MTSESVVNKVGECYRRGGELAVIIVVGKLDMTFVMPRPWTVEVLKPSCLMAATRSAFWTGFARKAAKRSFLRISLVSEPYALTARIGVFAFLLLVVLMYLAAPSPSTR